MVENILILDDDNFQETILNTKIPVLVDFWANWCGPCMMLAPEINRLAAELKGQIQVCKINVDDNRDTADRLGIISIPTLMVFKEGKEVERTTGFRKKEELLIMMQKHL
ncbi:thioredoxin [Desulforamulus ferrireducens]|uniref:Thioredoxin n=1 Tax=Desulforamulus ferrireducens TaxID=1833852 RepID=A0A1S6IUD2_9FIRM|nr:thioredoxin [Desulforamulus ferrireducens]AQS58373.1 thioredoxin [Desulforamulus ferrireducens]